MVTIDIYVLLKILIILVIQGVFLPVYYMILTGKKSTSTPVSHFFHNYMKDVTYNFYFYLQYVLLG